MGPVEAKLHCIVDKFRSWIPRRTETSDTSRIFWMPDQSCRVCYECDLPFTIFNRRHHCRICGRVFCGRCTVNTIPSAFAEGRNYEQEDRERIRVCIFCFKQWERETMPAKCNGLELLSPGISPSLSCTSLASSESSGNSNSTNSSSIRSIMPHKAVPYQHIAYSSRLNLVEANGLDQGRNSDNTDLVSILESEGPTSSTFGISTNRNEDEDDEYTKLFEDPEQCISRKPGENYQDSSMNCPSVYSFNKVNSVDLSSKISMDQDFLRKTQTSGEQFIEEKMLGSSQTVSPGTENPFLVMQERSGEESESTDNGDECNDESPMFESTSPESEQPIDIENNGIIWIPPEPEDEEDEKENSVFDDDDDDGGGWALPHSTGSFTDSEYKSKDRVSEEHRKAMTAVLDGHFRALVAQLLKAENVPVGEENNKESWLEIVTSLSWQAASLVKPDTSKGGGGMDPGGYVKVKCLACGHPYQSEVIKGVVCKKNIANRRMTKSYKNPRLLILGGALEYQRVSNVLSSLDTLIQQEMEHLKMTVAKVEAHHPNVLLVEKTVSRPAQDYLLAKEISLVLNIKRSLLERIARCTGAQIVPSVDNLTAAKVGHCESFHVDKFVEEHDSAGQTGRNPPKTLMFFEGCPKPLGCTVLLKGSNSDELKKVKRVVQYSVFAAYHLAVETSFLADEGATLPELSLKSPITVALPDKISNLGRSISTIPGFMIPTSVQINKADMHFPAKGALTENSVVQQNDMHAIPENVSCLPSSGHLISELSSSIKKTFEGAVLFSSSKSHEGFATSFNSADQRSNSSIIDDSLVTCTTGFLGHQFPMEEKSQDLQLESQENMEDQLKAISFMDHKIIGHDNHNNMHSEGQRPSKEDFPPPDQQSILVSLSTRCVWKGTICERAHLFRIKYYGSFDKPLGRFLRDDLFNQNYRCNSCDAPTEAHVHCYTHQQGSLTIAVKRLDETVLPGEREGKIWMWHLCVKCTRKTRKPLPTRRVVMSDSACALSFGKFLELSFSNHAAASGAANCGHSLHRDCLRFYGFGRMVACFRYAPIHVHSVHLPPPKLEFNDPNQQEWLTKEISDVEDKAELLFAEVFDSLRQIGEKIASSGSFYVGTKVPESRRKITEYEGILQKEKTYLEDMKQKSIVKDHKPGQPIADILELNRVRFKLNCQSREWKNRLQFLASFLKRPPGSSTSSIPEELNLLLQKEKDKDDGVDNLSIGEKTLQRNRVEKYDGDACKIVAPAAEGNGYISGENVEDNSGISEKLKSGGTLVIKKQGITLASSIEDSFQNHLLNDSFMSTENIDNGLGAVDKMNKSLETGKLKLLQHDETNINVSYNDSSTVKQALTCHPLSTDVNGNRICRILRENKLTDTVDGGDKKDYFVGDSEFNRTLSEGKVKKCVNLSDTLDAAWTGEGQSIEPQVVKITSQGQEVGPGLAFENACADTEPVFRNKHDPLQVEKKISPTAVKAESMDYIANVQDKSEQERLQVSSPTSPVKSDISEEFGSWIGTSFSDLYKTYTKNFQGSLSGLTPRFDSLDNHIPSFVSSVSQLGDQGGARLSLVPGVGDIIIVIYDDEPTSIIAYALTSHEYHTQISDKNKQKEREREKEKEIGDSFGIDAAHFYSLQASEGSDLSEVTHREKSYGSDGSFTSGSKGAVVSDPFLFDKAMHVKVSFDDESLGWKVKYTVTCYYAVQFEALRKKCCSTELDFIRSLCRCRKWGAKGGKSNVFFAKTLDDRFIVKQVTKTELESFMKFAPEYFKYLSDSLSTGSPTCLAKILGIYQVTTKQAKGGREVKMDLMIMENLLYGRNVTRLYDLKGSVRSRYNPDSTGSNKVLLDQNLIEAMPTSPIFVGNKAKRLLERAVWNDTAFLALIDVMDYSLLVGVDEMRHELVLGIIDFLRQYTWDKHLETWVKASGILGGPKNTSPTVISPKQYKKRFRKAMSTYFLMVPDQWTPPTVDSSISHTDIREDVAPTIVQGDPP